VSKDISRVPIYSDDKQTTITTQEIYRVKYMDWLAFYKTYDIFPEFSKYIEERLNSLQSEIKEVFECNDIPDSFKSLALKHK
jgi:hypothetical protein